MEEWKFNSIYYLSWHYVQVRGQLHVTAALPQRETRWYAFNKRLRESKTRSGHFEGDMKGFYLPGVKSRFLCVPVRTRSLLVTITITWLSSSPVFGLLHEAAWKCECWYFNTCQSTCLTIRIGQTCVKFCILDFYYNLLQLIPVLCNLSGNKNCIMKYVIYDGISTD
jgi:hypothetical protein